MEKEIVGIVVGAMAGYGVMFTFLIRWITKKNDELLRAVIGNDREWKAATAAKLDDVRDDVRDIKTALTA